MRLATILPHASVEPVVVAAAPDGTWVELAGLTGRSAPRLEDTLPWVMAHVAHLAERAQQWTGPRYRESGFVFLPPVLRPPAFRDFCTLGPPAQLGLAPGDPAFNFSNPSALVGHEGEVTAPAGAVELDFELELGVVIGRPGRDIPVARAWEHVAGFTVLNDFSARDLQRREMTAGVGPVKAKDFATGLGPWLVTRDEFADRIKGGQLELTMVARVNGRELARGNSAELHHPIPRLIAQASRDAELLPGDLIGTGVVGPGCILELGPENTGGWLKPGDVVELAIERVGTLRHRITARPR